MQLDYFYGGEAEQFYFYRIPKALFTKDEFQELSIEAKLLYGLMLDRMSLSLRNEWVDEENRVFIIFTLKDAMAMMGIRKDKAVKLFKELDGNDLIERKKQGMGRPTKIYVKNFAKARGERSYTTSSDVPTKACDEKTSEKQKSSHSESPDHKTSEKPKSTVLKNRSHDFGKTDPNNTEEKDTELIYTDPSFHPAHLEPSAKSGQKKLQGDEDRYDRHDFYRETIRENIDYDYLRRYHGASIEIIDEYVDIMVDACCSQKKAISVNGGQVAVSEVKRRLLRMTSDHILYALECMSNNSSHIGNIRSYILTVLYNAPSTMLQYYASKVNHDFAEDDKTGQLYVT